MIRRATEEDLPQLLGIGERFCAAAGQVYSGDALERSLRLLLESEQAAIFVDEDVTGVIAGLCYHSFFSGQLVAQEMFWWAEKDGVGLLKRFEEWAQDAGAERVIMLCLDAIEPERVSRIYQRRGYVPLERSFMRTM